MKVVIPMSGMSRRFSVAGYKDPKYLLEIDGMTVIEHIVKLYPKDSEFVFIVNDKHKKETNVVEVLNRIAEDSTIITINQHKKGPVHTVLEAQKYIDDEIWFTFEPNGIPLYMKPTYVNKTSLYSRLFVGIQLLN